MIFRIVRFLMAKGTSGIDEWYSKRPEKEKNRRKGGWMSFLAVLDEVVAAINAGYSLKVVHEYLSDQGKLKCSYDTFRGYVKKLGNRSSTNVPDVGSKLASKQPAAKKQPIAKTEIKSFTFDPKPNIDDIY